MPMLSALLLAACLPWAVQALADDQLQSKQEFLARFGDEYGYDGRIDGYWEREIKPRMPAGEHYLDFTGSSLYWNSQVQAAAKELEASIFGNPHSASPSSFRTEHGAEEMRLRVLRFLGADPALYDLVFTRSGTGALHNLGETFPFTPRSSFAYLDSNHNSVLGIREYARRGGAAFGAVTEGQVEAWLGQPGGSAGPLAGGASAHGKLPHEGLGGAAEEPRRQGEQGWAARGARRQLAAQHAAQRQREQPALALSAEGEPGSTADSQLEGHTDASHGKHSRHSVPTYNLFAFPAYDNFAGVMYPLRWVKAVQAKSSASQRWKVLLDAAAFLPAHPLNLTETPADFVCISFYKLFGYPTGVGAWVVRRDDLAPERKLYWGGGSVFLATSTLDWKLYRPVGPERFEDGTLPFLNILNLQQGLDVYATLGGPAAIERHTNALREWLYGQLSALKHSNGAPLLHIFGRHHWPNSRGVQGSTFNFLILKPNGEAFSYRLAAVELGDAGFHMRCGCTCNPGACYAFLRLRDEEVRQAAELAKGNFSNWEWAWVRRKPGEAPPWAIGSSQGEGKEESGGHIVRLPLGSLRASLGYMSRFEDAHALVAFLKKRYMDRTDGGDTAVLPAASADYSSDGAGAGAAAELQHKRRMRWATAELQGPGWC